MDDARLDELLGRLGRDDEEPPQPAGRRRRRGRRVLGIVGGLVLLLAIGVGGALYGLERSYDNNIRRVPDVFAPVQGASPRPPKAEGTGENWLLVGSDRRADVGTTGKEAGGTLWKPGAQRTDTVMLVHLAEDRKHAYLISFPRDSWVAIPGHGTAKINAAFSYGGPPLLIATLEQLTGIHIDHYAAIDFDGFETMTAALGGVDVTLSKTVYDSANHKTWSAGTHHLEGEEALLFVRQRYGLPGGDFDRMKRQQAFIKALMRKALSRGVLTNPVKLNNFLQAATRSVTVDDSVTGGTLRSEALGLRGLRMGNIAFMTVPVTGTGREGKQSVVHLAKAKDRRLYTAIRRDRVDAYLAGGGETNSLDTVR